MYGKLCETEAAKFKLVSLICEYNANFHVSQAREKFLSLRKSTRMDVAVVIEEVYPK